MFNRSIAVLLLTGIALVTGCRSLPTGPAPVRPSIVKPDAPLERLREFKQDGHGNLVLLLTDKNTSLPPEAAPITPLLARALGTLEPSGIFFYPGWIFTPGGRVEKGDPDFNVKPSRDELLVLESRHRNADETPAGIVLLGLSAHMDRDVYRVRKNATVRALAEARGGYLEGNLDFEVEDSVSVLTITLGTQAPTYEVTSESVQIKAELFKQSQGAQFALFVFGSGGKLSKNVTVTQGLSEAIEVCIARAVLELCGQLLGIESEQFLLSQKPAARPIARKRAPLGPVHGEPTPSTAPQKGPSGPTQPSELILDYQIRTQAGLVVDSEPAVLKSGERFGMTLVASADCFMYVFAQNTGGFSLLHPRPGESTARLAHGMRATIPSYGHYTLDKEPGVEVLVLVVSDKPIGPFDAALQRQERDEGDALQSVMRQIMRNADQGTVSRTKLPSATRVRWPLVPDQTVLAARVAIDHR